MPSERTARVAMRRFIRNRSIRRSFRTTRTKADRALLTDSKSQSGQAISDALIAMDKAVTKGIIHRNKAARLKSRLARKFNSLSDGS